MKKDLFFYLLLAVLTAVDAWLLAHPNLLGKLGILFYKYDMLRTLPRAFATVAATVLVCLALAYLVAYKLPRPKSVWALVVLTLACLGLLVQTWLKFSAGSYALTGAGFKAGAVLLPAMMALIFGKTLYDIAKTK
jgi:ABC-type spermidine/putrescine transport system permease subunit I